MKDVNDRVRAWLRSGKASFYDAPTPQECVKKAWGHSGLQTSLPDFESALKLHGFVPDNIRNARDGNPPLFRLRLPEQIEGVTSKYALEDGPPLDARFTVV